MNNRNNKAQHEEKSFSENMEYIENVLKNERNIALYALLFADLLRILHDCSRSRGQAAGRRESFILY